MLMQDLKIMQVGDVYFVKSKTKSYKVIFYGLESSLLSSLRLVDPWEFGSPSCAYVVFILNPLQLTLLLSSKHQLRTKANTSDLGGCFVPLDVASSSSPAWRKSEKDLANLLSQNMNWNHLVSTVVWAATRLKN